MHSLTQDSIADRSVANMGSRCQQALQKTSHQRGKRPTCILRETACSWPLRLYIFVTACRLRIKDLAMTLTASYSRRGSIRGLCASCGRATSHGRVNFKGPLVSPG